MGTGEGKGGTGGAQPCAVSSRSERGQRGEPRPLGTFPGFSCTPWPARPTAVPSPAPTPPSQSSSCRVGFKAISLALGP